MSIGWLSIGLMILGAIFIISGLDLLTANVEPYAAGQIVIGAGLMLWGWSKRKRQAQG